MPFAKNIFATLIIVHSTLAASAQEPTLVQPFTGSEFIQQYAVDFDRLTYLTKIEGEESATSALEGQVRAGIYRWPEGKSPLEIQRSFEKALEEAGFTILANADIPQFSPEAKAVNDVQAANNVRGRGFGLALQQVEIFPGHYLSAERSQDGEETVFTLTMSSNQPVYMMEEASVAAMEEDTVTITAEALNSEIEEAGKAILYGVQFDTGSAVIRPSSSGSLETIAEVIGSRDGQFYVVGHTDDTGGFDLNMQLSADRASAIVDALVEQHGIDAARLKASGVGPLAPLASNDNDAGRQLNRRVELVEQLAN